MSTMDTPRVQCLCGSGYCKVKVSSSSRNPNRVYITCPMMDTSNKGCGLWQWLDEVRMCPCNAGICKFLMSHSKANPDRWFYTCPKSSVGVRGCGFFEWKTNQSPENIQVVGEKKQIEEKKGMEELRAFLEMKKSITNEVCESVLEKMKKLGLD